MRLIVDDDSPINNPWSVSLNNGLMNFKQAMILDTGTDLITLQHSRGKAGHVTLTHHSGGKARTADPLTLIEAFRALQSAARGDPAWDRGVPWIIIPTKDDKLLATLLGIAGARNVTPGAVKVKVRSGISQARITRSPKKPVGNRRAQLVELWGDLSVLLVKGLFLVALTLPVWLIMGSIEVARWLRSIFFFNARCQAFATARGLTFVAYKFGTKVADKCVMTEGWVAVGTVNAALPQPSPIKDALFGIGWLDLVMPLAVGSLAIITIFRVIRAYESRHP